MKVYIIHGRDYDYNWVQAVYLSEHDAEAECVRLRQEALEELEEDYMTFSVRQHEVIE